MSTSAQPATNAKNSPMMYILKFRFRRKCDTVTKQECHNVTVPEYEVITELKRERVPVQLPQCKTRFIRDQYCHTSPNGEIECRYVLYYIQVENRPRIIRSVCTLYLKANYLTGRNATGIRR